MRECEYCGENVERSDIYWLGQGYFVLGRGVCIDYVCLGCCLSNLDDALLTSRAHAEQFVKVVSNEAA